MIEVLYGSKIELINKYINNHIKSDTDECIKYDYVNDDFNDFLNELKYNDLFGNNKIIVLYNSTFLSSSSTLDNIEFDKYIENPNPNNRVFLVINEEKLDERKKVVKALKSKYQIKEFNSFTENDALKYINSYFKNINYKIDNNSVKKIYELLGNNVGLYEEELKKLSIFKSDEKEITVNDVNKIITKMPEEDIFKLTDAIMSKDIDLIFKIYKEMRENNLEDIMLVALLATQFRFLYDVKVLVSEGKNKFEITSMLSAHPYRVESTMRKIDNYNEEEILNILRKLSDIDYKLKTAAPIKNILLEDLFLSI